MMNEDSYEVDNSYLDEMSETEQTSNYQNNSIDSDNFPEQEEDSFALNESVAQTSTEVNSDIHCVLNSLIDQTCSPLKKPLPARDRRIEDNKYIPDYEENKSASKKYQLWGLYWNRSQTSFSVTANDDYIVKTVVKDLVDTIDAYEKQKCNKIQNIFGIKDQRHISNFNRHNPSTARKRVLNKQSNKGRYNYTISSDSDSIVDNNDDITMTLDDPELSVGNVLKKRKRKFNPSYDEHCIRYGKLPKKSKQGNRDEEEIDPTFRPQSTTKSAKKEIKVRRSGRFSQQFKDEIVLDSDESEKPQTSTKKVVAKRSLRSSKKSNATSNRVKDIVLDDNLADVPTSLTKSMKMFEEVKRRHIRTRLEIGMKLSNLKQRMGAKETVIDDLKEKYDFINSMKEKLDLERAQMKEDMSMAIQERDKAVAARDEISSTNIQLQNENTRIRKINVQLQNTIVNLDKKLRDKLATFEKLGLEDDTFGRFNPYSATTKLDARKNHQRMLFNCADVISAGTIDDAISLVSDLHKDLHLDPSIKEVGRGIPVLAELNKFKKKTGDKQNPTDSNASNENEATSSNSITNSANENANSVKISRPKAKKSKQQPEQSSRMLMPDEITLN